MASWEMNGSKQGTRRYVRLSPACDCFDRLCAYGRIVLRLQYERTGDRQTHIVADQRHIGRDAEIATLDCAGHFETGSEGFVQRIDAGTDEMCFKRDWFGDAVQSEAAGDDGRI